MTTKVIGQVDVANNFTKLEKITVDTCTNATFTS